MLHTCMIQNECNIKGKIYGLEMKNAKNTNL